MLVVVPRWRRLDVVVVRRLGALVLLLPLATKKPFALAHVINEVGSDEEPEEVGEGALDPADEAAAAAPGDDLLRPHGKRGRRTRTARSPRRTSSRRAARLLLASRTRRSAGRRDGKLTHRTVDVKRPRIVDEYFDGAQTIDVHNHGRQGSLALESRRTKRWDWRFFQAFLGIILVDAFTAYKRFCPHKADMDHTEFVLEVTFLLNNKIGVGDSAPVLRARLDSDSDDDGSGGSGDSVDDAVAVHDIKSLAQAEYYSHRGVDAPQLTCRVCKAHCYYYCATCSDGSKPSDLGALCAVNRTPLHGASPGTSARVMWHLCSGINASIVV